MSYAANKDKYPGSTVVLVQSTWGGQTFVGSGVIVGKNDVLTAAHVVYIKSLGGLADEVRIYPSYSPQSPEKNFYQPIHTLHRKTFVQVDQDGDGRFFKGDNLYGSYADSELDIALLSFDLDLAKAYGSMSIGYEFGSGNVGVLGYPGKYGNNLTYDDGFISKDPVDGVYLFDSSLEINPGNSGSPVYYNYGDGPYVVGLVSTSNWAVGLEQHRDWLAARMKANDVFLSGSTVASRLVATYPGSSRTYQFLSLGGGLYGVKRPLGAVDVITGSKTISFDDRSFDYYDDIVDVFFQLTSVDAVSGIVFRIYKAAFDRLPDAGGLQFWTGLNSSGQPDYVSTSRYFVESDEFRRLYGEDLSNKDFLTKMFENVLDRAPDTSGLGFWLNDLDAGTIGRAEVLYGFADSLENRRIFSETTGIF